MMHSESVSMLLLHIFGTVNTSGCRDEDMPSSHAEHRSPQVNCDTVHKQSHSKGGRWAVANALVRSLRQCAQSIAKREIGTFASKKHKLLILTGGGL
jgi:hypothetical protein